MLEVQSPHGWCSKNALYFRFVCSVKIVGSRFRCDTEGQRSFDLLWPFFQLAMVFSPYTSASSKIDESLTLGVAFLLVVGQRRPT